MQDFSGTEGLALNLAGLLEFQRHLVGNRKGRAAAQNIKGIGAQQAAGKRFPIAGNGLFSQCREILQRLKKCLILLPVGKQQQRETIEVIKVLVAATLDSVPAQMFKTWSLAAASGESGSFVRAKVDAPLRRAEPTMATISGLLPDWDMPRQAQPGNFRSTP